jgi:hypothetical protein
MATATNKYRLLVEILDVCIEGLNYNSINYAWAYRGITNSQMKTFVSILLMCVQYLPGFGTKTWRMPLLVSTPHLHQY